MILFQLELLHSELVWILIARMFVLLQVLQVLVKLEEVLVESLAFNSPMSKMLVLELPLLLVKTIIYQNI